MTQSQHQTTNLPLANKTALVTGGSSGIGAAAAKTLAAKGANVVVAARRQAEGQAVVDAITAQGGNASFIQTDVTQAGDAAKAVAHAQATYGGLHILFNNAGVEGNGLIPVTEESEDNLRNILEVNVIGAWSAMKAAIPAINASGGGSIINTSSVAGRKGFGAFSSYVASKFALEGLTRSVAQEVAAVNIRVNAIAPGPIQTDLLDRATDGDATGFIQMVPMQRAGTADEVANLVAYLASDESTYITGESFAIDGGMTA